MPLTVPAVLAVLVVGLSGCGDDANDDDLPTLPCEAAPVELTLLDAGAEPTVPLRLDPTPGDVIELDLDMSVGTEALIDGRAGADHDAPPLSFGLLISVDDVSDDTVDMSFTYDQASTDDDETALGEMLADLPGASGMLRTDRSGAFQDGGISTDGLDPEVESLVEQTERHLAALTAPLPTEPVGVGARWEVASSFESGGVVYCTLTTYTLTSLDGDQYELDIELTQGVAPTTIADNGTSIDVIGGSGRGTGHSSGSLNSPIAAAAATHTTSRTTMVVERDGAEQRQEIEIDLQLELRQRDGGP